MKTRTEDRETAQPFSFSTKRYIQIFGNMIPINIECLQYTCISPDACCILEYMAQKCNHVWRGAVLIQLLSTMEFLLRSGGVEYIFCQLQPLTKARLGNVPYNFQSTHLVRILDLMLLESTLSI